MLHLTPDVLPPAPAGEARRWTQGEARGGGAAKEEGGEEEATGGAKEEGWGGALQTQAGELKRDIFPFPKYWDCFVSDFVNLKFKCLFFFLLQE